MNALAEADVALAGVAPLPRDDDGPVFVERWHGRAFALGVLVLERRGLDWRAFSPLLAEAIAQRGAHAGEAAGDAYYAAWLDAVERLTA